MTGPIYVKPITSKTGRTGLVARSHNSEIALNALDKSKVYRVSFKEDRNWQLHDKYFAVLQIVFDNQEQFASIDQLREATLIEIGYSELREKFNGDRYYVAASMASNKLLEDWTIEQIYERSVAAWVKHFGYNPEEGLVK